MKKGGFPIGWFLIFVAGLVTVILVIFLLRGGATRLAFLTDWLRGTT